MEKIIINAHDSSDWHAYNEHVGYELYNAMKAAQLNWERFMDEDDDDYTKETFKKKFRELDKAYRTAITVYSNAVDEWINENRENIEFVGD